MERNYVVFRTAMFRSEQADEDIDRWMLGEDCARWLRSRLLAVEGLAPDKPVEEDWGWTFRVRSHGVGFWVKVWLGLKERQTWVIGIETAPGLLSLFAKTRTREAKARLRDALDSAITSSPEITGCRWLEKHPLEP